MGADHSKKPLACGDLLDAYVRCMEEHRDVAPDPYEPEWCDAEKSLYRACRDALKPKAAATDDDED